MTLKRAVQVVGHGAKLAWSRPKGWHSVLYNTAMAKAGVPGPLFMPAHVSIEPTNLCNARCPVCETGNLSMERAQGMLDFDNYRRFIDEIAPHTTVLMFYFMGEPFLHRNAYDMIRYAREKNIYVETCTNGDFVDAKGLIYSDINRISFQIGGMIPETHAVYRVRSNLVKVRRNLEALLEERRRHPDSNVTIEIGFIVMRHNEHEVESFLGWAKDIGADVASVIDPCVRNIVEAHAMLPDDRRYWFYDEDALDRGYLRPKKVLDNECTWVWNSVMVNWDGSVVPCCRDTQGRHIFGNAFETPLRELWNGPAMRDFRRKIASDQRNVDICELCSGFGVPHLMKSEAVGFEVRRLSNEATPIEELLADEGSSIDTLVAANDANADEPAAADVRSPH